MGRWGRAHPPPGGPSRTRRAAPDRRHSTRRCCGPQVTAAGTPAGRRIGRHGNGGCRSGSHHRETAAGGAVESAFREPHRIADEFLDHAALRGTDAAILLGEVGIGAGVAGQHRKPVLGRVHGARDVLPAHEFSDPEEPLPRGIAFDVAAMQASQRRPDPGQQAALHRRVAHPANFPPEDEGQIPEVVPSEPSTGVGEAVGMGGSAATTAHARPLDESLSHEPVEPLPHGGGRDPERCGE